MKSAKLLVALAATGLVATSAFAQKSAFEGFYGQISTGYENNQASSLGFTDSEPGQPSTSWNASNQSFGGVPLVIGAGYNFSVAPKWVIGLGADYSALNQKSSTYSYTLQGISLNGSTIEVSNRYNVFIAPGYEIEKDKLVYLKAGYSGVTAKSTSPNSYSYSGGTGSIMSNSQSNNLSGYVVGLGYKQFISGGFYGLAEVNYMSYSKTTFSSTADGVTSTANPGLSSYQVLVGVGYKF
jgi:opacity protein-like surface antigen